VATLDLGQAKLSHPPMVVPLSAIVSVNDGTSAFSVFVVAQEGGKDVAHRRSVTPGDAYGSKIAITGNVNVGERVITNGATLVADGQPVHVTP
jgi:multidrug efflux pump subunit AcrA (membrane-fusion protein)